MPVVKGGVWTNIEDEILKASVSKYGLNQWARVSSLLARKTPKQCKARWYEWLDPSIKKIEWSREEDEKLLHVAKLMPTQWKTIAQVVGRTANQCLERYQKLLDEAEAREGLGLMGPDGGETSAPTAEDVRKLRPGELDPDPETRPARPDTIDLDEDEKEMLSEARARLANTQGKKAKRKARERQQEESRRLAALQKRRELKAAGINVKVRTHKPGQMDYNADIPFEKKPALGFYDTNEEQSRNEYQRAHFDPRKVQLAGKRKGEGDEAGDKKRRKDEKPASLQAALKAGQAQKLREAEQSSKRKALSLPAPQVSDGELEEIVKMGVMGERASTLAQESDNTATRGLVGDYSTLNTNAPIRTPMAPAQEDHITNELRNIRALTQTQSSLLGGENTPLHEGSASTGFDGITPRRQLAARTASAPPPCTPAKPPMRTPRDSFALNAEDGASAVSATPRDLKLQNLAVRQQLRHGLASLPKPKDTEWELELPEEKEEASVDGDLAEEDAAERDRREREIREAREALERRRRTQVVQRDLPRPARVDVSKLLADAEDGPSGLIAREVVVLMAGDARKFPLEGGGVDGAQPPLETIDDDALAEAGLAIMLEAKAAPSREEVQKAFDSRSKSSLILGLGCYDDDDEEVKIAAMTDAYDAEQEIIQELAQSSAKTEKKLALHLGGYQKRQKALRDKIVSTAADLVSASDALSAFKTLAVAEDVSMTRRLEALREEVEIVSRRGREAQGAYRTLRDELDGLVASGA
ncbi:related to myb-related protein cdc5 [Cephalotrichum gorgonifer]|uniref:Related to myb-related protein cdc5 n=1 Tax=Cephalotrichum gorgonifer TaxID=2041049 RepID=A0AAE8MTD2_9PEZI|nr:related to myb-related protein cdc5 [Cephalotrichum gorgonifer]